MSEFDKIVGQEEADKENLWRSTLAEGFPGLNPDSTVAARVVELFDARAHQRHLLDDAWRQNQEEPHNTLNIMISGQAGVITLATETNWTAIQELHSSIYGRLEPSDRNNQDEQKADYEEKITEACEAQISKIEADQELPRAIKDQASKLVMEFGHLYLTDPRSFSLNGEEPSS